MRLRQLSVCCARPACSFVAVHAQTAKKSAPAKKATAPALTKVDAEVTCSTLLGIGVKTRRAFCDILTGRDPKEGVLVTIPPHRGPVILCVRAAQSPYLLGRADQGEACLPAVHRHDRRPDAGQHAGGSGDHSSEFRTAPDLFDRIEGGAGPGGVKAVAPAGVEFVSIELPEDVGPTGEHPGREPQGEAA